MRAEKPAPSWLVWAALGIVYVVWGSTYLAIRITVTTMPPLLSASARFLVAGVVAYAFLAVRRGWKAVRVTRAELAASTFVGGALLLGGNGLVMIGEQHVASGLAALIIAAVPLWVVLLRRMNGDRAGRGTLLGVGAGFVGVVVLLAPAAATGGTRWTGGLMLLAASLSWAIGSFFSKSLPLPRDVFVSTALQMLCGGALLGVAGLARGELSNIDLESFSGASLVSLAYLVVIGSWLAFTAYVWVLQHAPISKVATYAYVNPVIAVLLGWLVLNEPLSLNVVAGAIVVVLSVAFIVSQESPRRAVKRQSEATRESLAAGITRA